MKRTPAFNPFPTTSAPHPEYRAVIPPVLRVVLMIPTTPSFFSFQLKRGFRWFETTHLTAPRAGKLCLGFDKFSWIRDEALDRSSNDSCRERFCLRRLSMCAHISSVVK
jgi:hypothetical protein